MDESRKQFAEAFEELTGWELEDYPDKAYADTCWEFWRMSRAAIEINLPEIELVTDALTAPGDGWEVYDAQKVDKALCDAGIKVKE
ncbi:hypothetical protein [Enterobacter quasiroggenkampii]|uniref:hypothetical protein n=1 Tax=Enterobacter quasiroggenkampii TaxID=2497436 RepID=UPI0039C18DF2